MHVFANTKSLKCSWHLRAPWSGVTEHHEAVWRSGVMERQITTAMCCQKLLIWIWNHTAVWISGDLHRNYHRQCEREGQLESAESSHQCCCMNPGLCSSAVGPVAQWQDHPASIRKVSDLNTCLHRTFLIWIAGVWNCYRFSCLIWSWVF